VVFCTIIKKDGFVGGDLCIPELFCECVFEGILVGDVRVHLEDVPDHAHFFMAEFDDNSSFHPLRDKRGHIREPHPTAWNSEKCLQWLKEKPLLINQQKDYPFMNEKMQEYKMLLAENLRSNAIDPDSISVSAFMERPGWQGGLPYICLFHILSLNEFKEGFLTKDRTMNHLELENCNSTACAAIDFWDRVMEKFNDENFKPFSYELKNWGKLFETSHDLSWSKLHEIGVRKFTDKCEVKERFRQINNELGSLIADWTQSGSGDDTYRQTLEDKDELSPEEVAKLPSIGGDRSNFIGKRHPMTMYLWYVLLANGLYQTVLTELHRDSQAEGARVPSVLRSSASSVASIVMEENGTSDIIAQHGYEIIQSINQGFDQQALASEVQ